MSLLCTFSESSVYSVEIDESSRTEYVDVANTINSSNTSPPPRSITTTDLLCWSFQIACGMRYLSSRKVLHNDLAARNVLLCDNNVVKIGDFGLARSLYTTDEYHKEGEVKHIFYSILHSIMLYLNL